jgi:uncharacterized protein (DUF433 family)
MQPMKTTTTTKVESPSKVIAGVIWINPDRVSGAPCFINTRVPIQNLFDYLEGGEPLDDFLEGFPPVTREQAIKVLELAKTNLLNSILPQ